VETALDPGEHGRHPAQSQWADQGSKAQIGVEVVRHGQDLIGGTVVEACRQDRGESACGRGLGGCAEIQPDVIAVVRVDVKDVFV